MIALFSPSDRVLVLGASGWFGLTMLDLVPPGIPVLPVAGSSRNAFVAWDEEQVRAFAPTVVANFAFLTRERVEVEGESRFRMINEELTRRFVCAARLPSVETVVTASSGAAVTEPTSPYGELKRAEEAAALGLVTDRRSVVVARAYSVSGAHVRRPHDYAFSDLILQAQQGAVRVMADRPVLRRYVSVGDLLQVCLGRAQARWSGVIDSGGELVEMGELARRVVAVVNPAAVVDRVPLVSTEASIYASDDVSWSVACAALGYVPDDLDTQIRATAVGLASSRP